MATPPFPVVSLATVDCGGYSTTRPLFTHARLVVGIKALQSIREHYGLQDYIHALYVADKAQPCLVTCMLEEGDMELTFA